MDRAQFEQIAADVTETLGDVGLSTEFVRFLGHTDDDVVYQVGGQLRPEAWAYAKNPNREQDREAQARGELERLDDDFLDMLNEFRDDD